ncbi:glycosyltransferase family 2 protein [Flavobacteriales bacterium]|nr:glycosyltransferase family 2 protein [Flavobacteriales bacterium]
MNPVDIIIPIKGRPAMLRERSLPALQSQTIQDFKVTIVDDGSSSDDFVEINQIIGEFCRTGMDIKLLKNIGNPGAAGARNFGFNNTSSKYVLWYDSDDILLDNKLETSLALIASSNFDFAITRAQHVRDGQLINEYWGEPQAPNRGKYAYHFPYQTMCALYHRQFLIDQDIKWNETINVMDDWAFSNEAILTSHNWVFSPVVTAHYFVPTEQSGSIGSKLTPSKIDSQIAAINGINTTLSKASLEFTAWSRLRIQKHLFHLKRMRLTNVFKRIRDN